MISYIASLFAGIGLWTALGVTLVAGLMRGFAGFGSAMLMAPIFAILFGSADMVVTVVAIELVVSVQLFPQVRRHADWRVLTPMSVAACAAMPLGVWLLASVDKNTIVTTVSALIVAFVVLMWSGWKYTGRRSTLAGVAVGAVSGAMMATTSIGGPPVLLYLLSGNDPPQVNRANIVTYYFLTQFLLIVIVLVTGVAGFDALARAVVLFPVMVLGAWAGGRAFHGLASERLYRNVALGILFSRLTGLIRQIVFAHYFGVQTDAADAFTASYRIPNFLQNLFGEGALSASFIPVYASLLARGDRKNATDVAGAVGALLSLVTARPTDTVPERVSVAVPIWVHAVPLEDT